jgi:hypothetical protein
MNFVLSYGSSFMLSELSENLLGLSFIISALFYGVDQNGGYSNRPAATVLLT